MDILNIPNPRIVVLGLPKSGRTTMARHIAAMLQQQGCSPVLLDGVIKQEDGEIPAPLPFARFGKITIEVGDSVDGLVQDPGSGHGSTHGL